MIIAKTKVSNTLWGIQKMNLDVLMLDREEGKGAWGEESARANSEACEPIQQSAK